MDLNLTKWQSAANKQLHHWVYYNISFWLELKTFLFSRLFSFV